MVHAKLTMIKSITLGTDVLTNEKRFCLSISNLSFPEVVYSSQEKGSFFGKKISTIKLRSFKFSTEWVVLGSDFSDIVTQRKNFLKYIGGIISEGGKILKIENADGNVLQITVKGLNVSGDINPDNQLATPFLIDFDAEYPFLQSPTDNISEIPIFSGGGMGIPMGIPMSMAVGGSAAANVVNDGNYDAYPLYTFYGVMQNPTLTNQTTGKSMSLTYNLTATSQYIVVDSYLRTVVFYAGGNNVRQYFTGDFFTLPPGINALKLTVGSGTSGKVGVSFKNNYLSI